ncbi:MAG: hypothetical protein EB103_01425, partial [Actinobacteria bacterium]|nr:hypothetical protein [Actinomycetota bacterium]
ITGGDSFKSYHIIRQEFDEYQNAIEGNPEYYLNVKAIGLSAIGMTGATLYSETDHLMIGHVIPGVYATGWIKRGPVGLIGHTKADAMETIACILADKSSWWSPAELDENSVNELLSNKGIRYLGWPEWLKIDATEKRLGEAQSRERVKLVERQDFLDAAFQNNS